MQDHKGGVLARTWEHQRQWSALADSLKRALDRWQRIALALTVSGAVLATLALQIDGFRVPLPGEGGTDMGALPASRGLSLLGILSTLCLGLAAWTGQRFLDGRLRLRWIRARSLSEALKKAVYLFRAQVGPYAGDDVERHLLARRQELEGHAGDLLPQLRTVTPRPKPVPDALSDVDAYIGHRVEAQLAYYRRAVSRLLGQHRLYRRGELLASALAVVLSAFGATPWGEAALAWVAVVTSIGVALATHMEARRLDYLMASYAATANHLQDLEERFALDRRGGGDAESMRQRFVEDCEAAISNENEGWMAKLGEPAET